MLDAGHALSREQIAADWYDRVYLPAVEAIHRERLHEAYPEETDGDLFLFVHRRRRELAPERGCLQFEEAALMAAGERGRQTRRARRRSPAGA